MKMTTLGKLNAEAWFVGNNARGGTSLFRQYYEGGSSASVKLEELVPDVSSMSISYLLSGTEQYQRANSIGAGDWSNVIAVYIELTITRRLANAAIKPISRTVGITVKLRNRASTT
jgi:type IV pilus assembly protein PilW